MAHQDGSFRLIVASFLRLAPLIPLPTQQPNGVVAMGIVTTTAVSLRSGLTRRCYLVGATAAHQGGSFRLIVASFYRIACLLPPPFLHETTIKRCIGDGDGHDDNGKFGVGFDDAVPVGWSDGGESGW